MIATVTLVGFAPSVVARAAGGQSAQQPGALPRSGVADGAIGAQGVLLADLALTFGRAFLRRARRA